MLIIPSRNQTNENNLGVEIPVCVFVARVLKNTRDILVDVKIPNRRPALCPFYPFRIIPKSVVSLSYEFAQTR